MSSLWIGRNICAGCPHLDYCEDKEGCEAYEILRRLLRSGRVSTKDIEEVIAE